MVLISAGSSAGAEDYTRNLIAELGQVVVHGVAIKPGKPVVLGIVEGKPGDWHSRLSGVGLRCF